MADRIQIVAILGAAGLLLFVFELVRRRRLLERYALLWLASGAVLLALAVWRGLLTTVADAIGIFYPPSALFVVAFGFVLVLLLHFSLVISRLADQSKVLAQRVGLLQQRLEEQGHMIDALRAETPAAGSAAAPERVLAGPQGAGEEDRTLAPVAADRAHGPGARRVPGA